MALTKYSHLKPLWEKAHADGAAVTHIARQYKVSYETVKRYLRRNESNTVSPVTSKSARYGLQAIQPEEIAALRASLKPGDTVTYIKRVEYEGILHAVRRIKRHGKVIGVYPHGVLADVKGEVVKRFITYVDILQGERNLLVN